MFTVAGRSGRREDVVRALADGGGWRYADELCRRVGRPAGAVYPVLMRLADRGLIETAWDGDPPRHRYRLTASGLALAADLEPPHARREEA